MVIRRADGPGRLIIVRLTGERIDRARRAVKGWRRPWRPLCVIEAHSCRQPDRAWKTPLAHNGKMADEPRPALHGVRILVVDDDDDTRELLTRILERRGAKVIAAGSANEAWAVFEASALDVLLVDIAMPIEDGYSFLRRVRACPPEKGGRVPAAALTARVIIQDRLESLRAGFQSHMAKPVDPEELVEVMVRLAGRD
jgi:CheY-like chemotaxis protein